MINPLLVIIVVVVIGWIIQLALMKRAKNGAVGQVDAIRRRAKGKAIHLKERHTGKDLGTISRDDFDALLDLYSRETNDITSFFIIKEILPFLEKDKDVPRRVVTLMGQMVGDREEIDVVWEFE